MNTDIWRAVGDPDATFADLGDEPDTVMSEGNASPSLIDQHESEQPKARDEDALGLQEQFASLMESVLDDIDMTELPAGAADIKEAEADVQRAVSIPSGFESALKPDQAIVKKAKHGEVKPVAAPMADSKSSKPFKHPTQLTEEQKALESIPFQTRTGAAFLHVAFLALQIETQKHRTYMRLATQDTNRVPRDWAPGNPEGAKLTTPLHERVVA